MNKKIVGFLNLYNSPELGPLTEKRTLGSTSFLGRFALMDIALSNFTNSGINNINIMVRDNFRSVSKHVGSLKPWVKNTKSGRQHILLNEKGIRNPKLNNDIECLLENDWVLYEAKADIVVIQPAHILTTLNLNNVIEKHLESKKEITLVYTPIENADVSFATSNIIEVKNGSIVACKKNSQKNKKANVSLETYVINCKTLFKLMNNENIRKVGSLKKAIEMCIKNKIFEVNAFEYTGYARCFDSFEHFVEYSFELFNYRISKLLYGLVFDSTWPIYTVTHNAPPALYGVNSNVTNSFVANGSIIDGKVTNSIVSRYVTIGKNAVIKNCIILADSVIEEGAHLENVVVDKYVTICKNVKLLGTSKEIKYIEQGLKIK